MLLNCNWKAVLDNFHELYHVEHIHPLHALHFDCPTSLVDLFQRTTVASQAEQFAQARQADPVLARARARAMRQLKR